INESPYAVGYTFGSVLWVAYAWISRLRHDASHKPFIHAAFILSFVLCMVALLFTMFCDPGICTTPRSTLKSITEELVQQKRFHSQAFCVQCLVVMLPNTRHCHRCNKCVTHNRYMQTYGIIMVIVGAKNYVYFVIFMTTLTTCVLLFNHLVGSYLLALKDATRSCMLPVATCRRMSEDRFLSVVSISSAMQLGFWVGWVVTDHVKNAIRNVRRYNFRDLFNTAAVFA
ncbi:hypothetical protein BGW80DRAFT_1359000, partial [Lactifluus volemus]